jgi:single stranded DNA-binding protein
MPTTLTIAGNLCADPELRKTNGGLEIVELRIATDQGKDKTVYFTAKFFNNKAGEVALKYAKKGSSVFVAGSADEESWEKDGQKFSKIVCNATQFNFLGGKSDKADSKTESKPAASNKKSVVAQDENDDGPPF